MWVWGKGLVNLCITSHMLKFSKIGLMRLFGFVINPFADCCMCTHLEVYCAPPLVVPSS